MSKITFRADDELIEGLEGVDASKSEAMREALRAYLGETDAPDPASDSLDDLVTKRVEALIDDRVASALTPETRDLNLHITLDGDAVEHRTASAERKTNSTTSRPAQTHEEPPETCAQCGERLGAEHVYCPNCGEKASHRVFCDCGDELRSDWGFCPSCGRRTPAADVLDGS